MNRDNCSDSFIQEDGSLKIRIPPNEKHVPSNEVTWFSFLDYTRSSNSHHGGWNSKSYWIERGLKRLAHLNETAIGQGFLTDWTSASLAAEKPQPREDNFFLTASIQKTERISQPMRMYRL